VTKQNKITVFILVLIILPTLGYFYFAKGLDLDGFLNILKIPAIVVGVLLFILLNIPSVQKLMKNSTTNESQKKLLFLEQDEVETYTGRNAIFRLAFGFIPFLYLFSNVQVTNKRIKYTLYPFLSMPSWSLFYQKTESSFPYPPYIVSLNKNKGSLHIRTSDGEHFWVFIKDQKMLTKIQSVIISEIGRG